MLGKRRTLGTLFVAPPMMKRRCTSQRMPTMNTKRVSLTASIVLIVVISTCALSIAISLDEVFQENGQPCEKTNKTKEQDCTLYGASRFVLISSWSWTTTIFKDSANPLQAFSGLVQAVFAIVLFIVSRRQAKLTDAANRTAEKAANAARDSADATISAARPYVFFENNVKHSDSQETIKYCTAHTDIRGFNMKNYGSTAAFITSIKYEVGCFTAPPSGLDIWGPPRIMSRGNVLSSGEFWPKGWHNPVEITPDMIEMEDRRKGVFIYVYGEISYIDAFYILTPGKPYKSHYKTVFCRQFDGKNFVPAHLNHARQNDYT